MLSIKEAEAGQWTSRISISLRYDLTKDLKYDSIFPPVAVNFLMEVDLPMIQ